MYILAIETSCDDTSVAIFHNHSLISMITRNQNVQHNISGGVIPEIASRMHTSEIIDVIKKTLAKANLSIKSINSIAVTIGPGLINSLQVGIIVAKTLSQFLKIPLYGINHLDAHIFSPFINKSPNLIPKNSLGMILSGGNTIFCKVENFKFEIIGKTLDDSIGEAFDKVAKILELKYPGGPQIDLISQKYKGENLNFPLSKVENYNFSYSGIKSHVSNLFKQNKYPKEQIAYSFQIVAIKQIILKLEKYYLKYPFENLLIGGGVTLNTFLRSELKKFCKLKKINLFLPEKEFTNDNAAMIGYLGFVKFHYNLITKMKLNVDVNPKLNLGK